MTNDQFEDLKDLIDDVKSNTDENMWIKSELETLNQTMKKVRDLLVENNSLLSELIETSKR